MRVAETESVPDICKANVNVFWSYLTANVLASLGVKEAILSPGSRSAPLITAFVTHPSIEVTPILDERSAAFFALGRAYATKRPVVLISTSGTAVGNLYPAIIEASHSRVPLIVLTADRAPEELHCYDRQATDQVRIFSKFPRVEVQVPLPEANLHSLNYLRQTLIHTFYSSIQPTPGPVHINFPFRDPLAPVVDDGFQAFLKTIQLEDVFAPIEPFLLTEHRIVDSEVHKFSQRCRAVAKGLIIVGPHQPPIKDVDHFARGVAKLSEAFGFPVLVEGISPLRNCTHILKHPICFYDLILRNESLAKELEPDVIIHVGPIPVSKVLRAWLKNLKTQLYVIDPYSENIDCLHRRSVYLRSPIEVIASQLDSGINDKKLYEERWLKLEAQAQHLMGSTLNNCDQLFEGKTAWLMAEHLPEDAAVFVSSSMPMRDVEFFWGPNDRVYVPYYNRGVNGIDGILSTALGVAHRGQPTYLLTGDLALLHDSSGWFIQQHFKGHLTIILINNDGGGIFEFLPIAQFPTIFDKYIVTPQIVDFQKLAHAHGVEYTCPKGWGEFIQLLKQRPQPGVRLIEVKTDRKRDADFLKKTFAQLTQQLK